MSNHFFLLGAAKCGTLSLFNILKQHPEICFYQRKEPFFFELDEEFNRGVEFYHDKYFANHSGETWFAEARHRNLFLPWVPERIKSCFPEAKLMAILRNPVDRAFSHYLHWHRSGRPETESLSFARALRMNHLRLQRGLRLKTEREKRLYQKYHRPNGLGLYRTYLDSGHYAEQLERYLGLFDRDQLKVISFESFINAPRSTGNEVFDFLDLPPAETEINHTHKGKGVRSTWLQRILSGGKKLLEHSNLYQLFPNSLETKLLSFNREPKPEMSDFTRLWLYNYYRDRIDKLQNLVGLDVSAWRDPDYDRQVEPAEVIPG